MISFAEKRAIQNTILEQNKILSGNPSFVAKRQAQKTKSEAMIKLGLVGGNQQESGATFGLQSSGIKTREKINAQVASIVDQVNAGKDPKTLTSEEIDLLKQYSGKGGLSDNSQYEYYTPTPVAEGMWDLLKENGFENGNTLEPSTGSGVFSATKPRGTVITGTEIDPVSSTVNQILHPEDKILNQSFEKLAVATPDNHFDGVVGNVPFGDVRGPSANDDPQYKKEKYIERYFISRVIDKTRPGGLIALVVPTRVMGNVTEPWKKFRAEISRKAEFLGGHKLPSKTFGKQGTDVVTDIIVLRKHSTDLLDKIDGYTADTLRSANVLWDEFIKGKYWLGEGKRFIKGQYVPPNKDDFRPMEQVIAEEGMTDESLKRSLAIKFDSRIDWIMLDSVAPVINYYAEGDRRIINGKEHVLENGAWSEVAYTADHANGIDKNKFGAATLDDLAEILKSPESMLSITYQQAINAFSTYPNLFNSQQTQAILFAKSQPLDSLREQAYRGSLLGSLVTKYIARANNRDTDSADREHVRSLLEREFKKYGHPSSIKGFVLEGEQARYFGSFLQAIDKKGGVSSIIKDGIEDASGYNAEEPLSIVSYFQREGLSDVTLDDLKRLYKGGRNIESLGDIADIDGIVFTPAGFISTTKDYCNGEIYKKCADIQSVMDGETDLRIKDKYQKTIDLMLSKVRRTSIEDISFGLRDKWYDQKYKREFLEKSGYRFSYSRIEDVEKESETGEVYMGFEVNNDTADVTGTWKIDAGQRKRDVFARQLEYYMNGQSISYRLSKTEEEGRDRIADLRARVNDLEEQFKYFMQSHADFQEIERTYNITFNNYVKPEYDSNDLGIKGMSGKIKLHWYQNQGVRQLSEEGTGILGFDVGLGKAQPLDAKVLTPNGWVLMGDIKVGDLVISADGSRVPVTGVFPQGKKEIFEVMFSDGSKTRCCDEHLWLTKTEKDRKNERYHKRNGKELSFHGSVKSLSEIKDTLIYQTQKNHAIPLVSPADFDVIDFAIDPYVIGVLLGDGCFRNGGVTFTPGDDEIAERVAKIISEKSIGVEVKKVNSLANRSPSYSISQGNIGGNVENFVKAQLRTLGLDGLGSHEKFIPDIYKFGSANQRLELLRGLMDTDGHVSKDGITVQFTSTSKLLADGVVHLVQSLGGIAWQSSKIPTYTHNDERRKGKEAFTVSMRIPSKTNPFKLKRKAEKVKPKTKYQPVRFFTKIESIGLAEAQCISIDHPSHLYITDEFIVTHNTSSALALSAYDRQMGRSKKHCIVVPNSVLANWYMESKALYGDHNDVMFVGFDPVRDSKTGEIKQEPVLDENGQPKVNKFTGQIEYQDVLRKEDKDEVYTKMHLIPHTDKSIVIMTQEKFKDIPLREETRLGYAGKWVKKSMMSKAEMKKMFAKNGDDAEEKSKSYNDAKNQDRIRGQFSDEGGIKKDEYPYFEDMGFDRVIVDEAHQFRNSYKIQDGDTAKLAYLPNAAVSQRATDMAMKTAWLRDKYDGKGAILLTATPVANSPIEIFNMLSLVIDQSEFERIGIHTPDDFVRQFGIIQDVDKLTVRGSVEKREGLAGFKNLNALRGLFHRYALMRGPKDVDPDGSVMKLPSAVEMIDQLEMTSDQHDLYLQLREEAKAAGNPENVKNGKARPMFAVLRDMDRVTTDVDMYYGVATYLFKHEDQGKLDALISDLPDQLSQSFVEDEETGELKKLKGSKKEGDNIVTIDVKKESKYAAKGDTISYITPEIYAEYVDSRITKFKIDYVSHPLRPKYAKLIENMRAELDSSGKQLVFTEEKSQHAKLLRLITNHLPVTADQVSIINADTAAGEKLQQISDAFNRGEVRIIVANKKAEVGVNLQKGTSAIHHLTLPWNPASLQQRNGRGVRQGNTRSEVRVYYYQAKGSFDEYRLDLLKNKGNWIAALMDRNAENDSAENAEAMGAIEQAALLSDDREEFLKTMAEMKVKKEAEDRDRRNNTAKIKLGQLSMAVNFLASFETHKAKAISDAQKDIEKAITRFERLKAEGASKEDIDRAELSVAAARNKVGRVEATYTKKQSDAEAQKRQITAFLKGIEKKGELPFGAALLDAPESIMFTGKRMLITIGSVFKFDRNNREQISRVTEIDVPGRNITVEAIIGNTYGTYNADKLLDFAVEVKLAPDEMERMKWLNKQHVFKEFAEVDKDFFFNNFDKIQSDGFLYYADGGEIIWSSGKYWVTKNNAIYPDKNDRKLQSALIEEYKKSRQGTGGINSVYFKDFMPAIFGDSWESNLLSKLKTAQPEDIRIQAVSAMDEVIKKDMPVSDKEAVNAIIRNLGYSYYEDSPYQSIIVKIKSWMKENEFINFDEIERITKEVTSAKISNLREVVRQLEHEEQLVKEAALKSVPGYREIPQDLKDRFKALGIDVFYNTEVVQIATRWEKITLQPYDAFWMKDSGWTLKDRLAGAENPLKKKFDARFLGIKYSSDLPKGDRKYGDNTWRVPSGTDIEALYEALK